MLLYARMPRTLFRFGLIGNTVPPKGELIRFQSVVRPTLPAVSVAPTTAILFGEKNESKGCSPCSITEVGNPELGLTALGLLVVNAISDPYLLIPSCHTYRP